MTKIETARASAARRPDGTRTVELPKFGTPLFAHFRSRPVRKSATRAGAKCALRRQPHFGGAALRRARRANPPHFGTAEVAS